MEARPPAELKNFCKFNGEKTTLSIFKVKHIVRRKPVSLQPCAHNNLASKTFSTTTYKAKKYVVKLSTNSLWSF